MDESFEDLWKEQLNRSVSNAILSGSAEFPAIYSAWEKALNERAATGILEAKSASHQRQFQNPATAHYFMRFFDPWEHPGDGVEYTVELARVDIPIGSIGIVRRLNQWVSGLYTTIGQWGMPFTGGYVDNYVWSLRTTPFNGSQQARLISTQPFLPGSPYPDLPEWRYLWFFPHNPESEVNLVIPGGNSLRFFVRTTALQEEESVFGRLVGYWQSSELKDESGANARKGF